MIPARCLHPHKVPVLVPNTLYRKPAAPLCGQLSTATPPILSVSVHPIQQIPFVLLSIQHLRLLSQPRGYQHRSEMNPIPASGCSTSAQSLLPPDPPVFFVLSMPDLPTAAAPIVFVWHAPLYLHQ